MADGRSLLVAQRRLSGVVRLYRTPVALEVDEFEQGEITRRRVFYDDVLLVTHHDEPGWVFLATTAALGGLLTWLAVVIGRDERMAGLFVFGMAALPLLAACAVRSIVRAHTVTVYGRRNKVRVALGVRRRRARALFAEVCRLVETGGAP